MARGGLLLLAAGALLLGSKRGAASSATVATPIGPGPPLRHDVPASEAPSILDPALPEPGPKASGYPGAPVGPPGPVSVQLESRSGYVVKRPHHAWGTRATIDSIQLAMDQWGAGLAEAFNVQDWTPAIWDISKMGGGFLPPHVSHQQGRDVDINFLLEKGEERWRKLLTLPLLPLLIAFLTDPNTEAIFLDWDRQEEVWSALEINPDLPMANALRAELQYPLPKYKGKTRIRHSPGHHNHIHVRFRA